MVKKKVVSESVTEAEQVVVVSSEAAKELEPEEETNPEFARLLEALQKIRQNKAVLGYILRNDDKAAVDLDEPTRIVEYAMLFSQAMDSSQTLASEFSLGDAKAVLVEGKQAKAFCVSIGENKLALFLEKNADHEAFLDSLLPF